MTVIDGVLADVHLIGVHESVAGEVLQDFDVDLLPRRNLRVGIGEGAGRCDFIVQGEVREVRGATVSREELRQSRCLLMGDTQRKS